MPSAPLFSFVVVNFKSVDKVDRLLASLTSPLTRSPHEIILVNNDLGERTALEKVGAQYGARIEHLQANYGFSRASNVGARLAHGEILFFLNPDMEYRQGSFGSLKALLDQLPDSIVGARLMTTEGAMEPWSFGRQPTLARLLLGKIIGWDGQTRGRARRVLLVDWVSGAALALRRETFEAYGGFDERFFLYFEDVDLCRRAQARGATVLSTPFLVFAHERGASHASRSAMKDRYFASQQIYFEKHGSPLERLLVPLLQSLYRLFFP